MPQLFFLMLLLLPMAGLFADEVVEIALAAQKAARDGNHQAAATLYSEVLNRRSLDTRNQAVAHYNRGLARHRLGQLLRAIEDYSAALALDATQHGAMLHKGQAYLQLGHSERALEDFEQILAVAPNNTDAALRKAQALSRLERHREALSVLEFLRRAQPQNPLLLAEYGRVLIADDQAQRAEDVLNQALALDEQLARSWLYRGMAREALGRPNEAGSDYLRAYALDDQDPDIRTAASRADDIYLPPSVFQGGR